MIRKMNIWSTNGFVFLITLLIIDRIYSVEIDLIEDLNHLPSAKPIISHSTIWSLNLTGINSGNNFLSQNLTDKILNILSANKGFSICVTLTQNISNSGTIFSITYLGTLRYFEVKMSLKRRLVKVLYFPDWRTYGYRSEKLTFNSTHEGRTPLCLQYSGVSRQLSLNYDCNNVATIVLKEPIPFRVFDNLEKNKFKIWIGQKMAKKGPFKGVLENMLFSTNTKFDEQYCLSFLTSRISTTTAVYEHGPTFSYRMASVENELSELKIQLQEMRKLLKEKKSCQCFPQCVASNGDLKSFGDSWVDNACNNCTCTLKGNLCFEETCSPLLCKENVTDAGKCCPRCPYDCQYMKKKYVHNQNFSIRCMECSCHDGTLSCRRINPDVQCPKLKCHKFLQVRLKGQCCKTCKALNLCELSKCGPNAHCLKDSTMFGCKCQTGYRGNPYTGCIDIDECQFVDSCPPNNECINTNGSYKCICKSGFTKINASSNICKATCPKNPCENNSTCVGLDQCECKAGFGGPRCDIDIDECGLGVIKCPLNSECINIPGGYICKCILGYHSIRNNTLSISFDHQCEDINECLGTKGVTHHCEASTICENLPGGYRCNPKIEESQIFGSNCAIQKPNGEISILYDKNQITLLENCKLCHCQNGVLTCEGIKCDCSIDNSLMCCPLCSQTKCKENTIFPSRVYNLAGTNCSLLHTSCSDPICPLVSCPDEISLPGQCCKYCRSDTLTSCIMTYNNQESIVPEFLEFMSKCYINGKEYDSGKNIIRQKFLDGSCLKCLCWNGHFCCGKSFLCADK